MCLQRTKPVSIESASKHSKTKSHSNNASELGNIRQKALYFNRNIATQQTHILLSDGSWIMPKKLGNAKEKLENSKPK